MPEPTPLDIRDITQKVAMVFSEPRFGPLDPKQCAMNAAGTFGLKTRRHGSAYWSQSLMVAAKDLLAENPDLTHLMFVDYDSMFRPQDVAILYGLSKINPDVDAICACQPKRDSGELLASASLITEYRDDLVRVGTGHFGLTLVKADKLRAIKGPWFLRVPTQGDETIDDDIYFWQQWTKAGNTLFLAPQVRIGQLEVVVTIPGPDWKPIRLSMREWEEGR